MKDIIVIVIIVLFVFGGNYVSIRYLEESGNQLIGIVEEMSNKFTDKNINKDALINNLKEKWEQCEDIWICLQYHQNINIIEDLVIECNTNFLNGKHSEFMVSKGKLIRNVEDLKNRESISFVNIF